METDSRELELNFDDSSQTQGSGLADKREELADEITYGASASVAQDAVYSAPDDLIIEDDQMKDDLYDEDDFYEAAPMEDELHEVEAVEEDFSPEVSVESESAYTECSTASAPVVNDSKVLLRSRHPVNRPAGTPPLENLYDPEPVTAMEMAIAGKSYGSALRILREQRGLSFKELEQVTQIQPRFLEALENEDISVLPLVYVIAFIKTLCRFYKISDDTAQSLVAKLKTQLEYSCNDEMINSLDVDRSGEADNEQKLKNIMMLFIGGIVALIALIVLVIVFFSGIGSKNDVAVGDGKINDAPAAATAVGSFKPESVEALLPKPVMTLPQLPVAQ